MKQVTFAALMLLLAQFLLPVLLIRGQLPGTGQEQLTDLLPLHQSAQGQDAGHQVELLMEDGTAAALSLDDYLWGVVAAEMPASFQLEALKAQAVAARTYWAARSPDKHEGGICADSGCCQAYITRQEAEANWGDKSADYARHIARAVEETDGIIAVYDGRPIQALFFSSAPGSTVDARAVWGEEVPYLVGVASPEGEEVPNYRSQLTVSADELKTAVLEQYPQADLSGGCDGWFSEFVREPSGTVNTVKVGGVHLKGSQVRKLLGLRSACFTVSVSGQQVTFHVTGYGHGVGMSQYGANAMAGQGKSFREILTWYYTGAELAMMD